MLEDAFSFEIGPAVAFQNEISMLLLISGLVVAMPCPGGWLQRRQNVAQFGSAATP